MSVAIDSAAATPKESRLPAEAGHETQTMRALNTQTLHASHAVMQTAAPAVALESRRAVLLVEDDRALRRYLEVILQRAGFNVITAADGLEAMKAALSNDIDAVVTDAIMPHLTGYELCRFLRRHPKLSKLPIILLSGLDQSLPVAPEGECPDAYMSKPVRPEELTDRLARFFPQTV